jgi:hypothetical protein
MKSISHLVWPAFPRNEFAARLRGSIIATRPKSCLNFCVRMVWVLHLHLKRPWPTMDANSIRILDGWNQMIEHTSSRLGLDGPFSPHALYALPCSAALIPNGPLRLQNGVSMVQVTVWLYFGYLSLLAWPLLISVSFVWVYLQHGVRIL